TVRLMSRHAFIKKSEDAPSARRGVSLDVCAVVEGGPGPSRPWREDGVSPPAILLPPLLAFDEACRLVVDHLKLEVPLAFWAVTRYEDDKQVGLCVRDDVY